MEQNHTSWQACSRSTGATGCAGTETTTPPCEQVPAHISLSLQQPQASTRHTPIMHMRRPRWRVDICPSLSKFTVDFTQGRKTPHSQHGDLPLSQKVLPLLAMQTVRLRALIGKRAGGALCSPLPQGQSLSDKFEVLPMLSLQESALLSQVGFLPGCGQPIGEPQKAHSHEIFPRTRLAGDPPNDLLSGGYARQSDNSDDNSLLFVQGHGRLKLSQVTGEIEKQFGNKQNKNQTPQSQASTLAQVG